MTRTKRPAPTTTTRPVNPCDLSRITGGASMDPLPYWHAPKNPGAN